MRLSAFELERYLAKYEFQVQHLLCSSDCESLSIEELLRLEPGAERNLLDLRLGYTEPQGGPALRREIARLYTSISSEDVLVHAGAEEAIFLFMNAMLEAEDEVIVHSPCYPSFKEIPKAIGVKVVPWKARSENGWSLDLNELPELFTRKTKAIFVNFPHNPTGNLMKEKSFRELSSFALERGILLFSDEVYRESEYREQDRLPAACDLGEHAVSLGVMSKTYGLAGLRIGWVATRNRLILRKMSELKDYTTICNSAPSEMLAEVALRHRGKLAQRNRDFILENLVLLDQFFERHKEQFLWQRPLAGPVAFPEIRDEWGRAEAFCLEMIEKAGVLLLPGTVFGDHHRSFRIGFGRRTMPASLAALEAALPLRPLSSSRQGSFPAN